MKTPEERSEYHRRWYMNNREKMINASKEWRSKNKEKAKDATRRWLLANPDKVLEYAISKKLEGIHFYAKDFRALEKKQKGKCAICKKAPSGRLHVDHCHKEKKVRGLLCGPCNRGLGMFYDNKKTLQAAIKYLCKK